MRDTFFSFSLPSPGGIFSCELSLASNGSSRFASSHLNPLLYPKESSCKTVCYCLPFTIPQRIYDYLACTSRHTGPCILCRIFSSLCLRLTHWLSPHPDQSLVYPHPVSCWSVWNVFHWFSAHWRSQLKPHLLWRASLETITFRLNALEFVTHVSFLMNQTAHSTKSTTALLAGRYLLLSTTHRTLRTLDIREGRRTDSEKGEESFVISGLHNFHSVLTALRS